MAKKVKGKVKFMQDYRADVPFIGFAGISRYLAGINVQIEILFREIKYILRGVIIFNGVEYFLTRRR